jgi:hypothetical protein
MNELKKILTENIIAKLLGNFKIVMQVDKTGHATDRQTRHSDTNITDIDIRDTVTSAMRKIVQALIFDKIDIGDAVLVTNKSNNLNVVGKLERKGDMLDFIVITVMIKRGFMPKKGTYRLTV